MRHFSEIPCDIDPASDFMLDPDAFVAPSGESEVIQAKTGAGLSAGEEAFWPFWQEVQPLLLEHWEELALNKDIVPLSPRHEAYKALCDAGKMLCVVLRDENRGIAGYFFGIIDAHLHYSTCLTLTMDIFRVLPGYRGEWAGVKLFREVERAARRRGVQRLFMGSKLHRDSSVLFRYLGYEPVEVYHMKMLEAD